MHTHLDDPLIPNTLVILTILKTIIMKKTYLLIFVFASVYMSAQDRIPVDLAETQITLSILSPSLALEKSITDNQSLHFSARIQGISNFDDDIDETNYGIAPELRAEFRNYYPRKKVKKELRPNSGNYIGLVAGYTLNTIADDFDNNEKFDEESSFFMGPVWGIQRNYKSGIHLGLSLGAGFRTGSNTSFGFAGVGSFNLGFVINTKE